MDKFIKIDNLIKTYENYDSVIAGVYICIYNNNDSSEIIILSKENNKIIEKSFINYKNDDKLKVNDLMVGVYIRIYQTDNNNNIKAYTAEKAMEIFENKLKEKNIIFYPKEKWTIILKTNSGSGIFIHINQNTYMISGYWHPLRRHEGIIGQKINGIKTDVKNEISDAGYWAIAINTADNPIWMNLILFPNKGKKYISLFLENFDALKYYNSDDKYEYNDDNQFNINVYVNFKYDNINYYHGIQELAEIKKINEQLLEDNKLVVGVYICRYKNTNEDEFRKQIKNEDFNDNQNNWNLSIQKKSINDKYFISFKISNLKNIGTNNFIYFGETNNNDNYLSIKFIDNFTMDKFLTIEELSKLFSNCNS
ncbi:hypothetical protein LY90DRAFT_512939 [Neocallimastix californiae]|uniref:Uncharacterized protein n=1 Tax=Neocallimastix californiae TaxID=1754190 RepID=A0A1Y2B312_9FUNG|nr:hypothetical protein LY90DRAFT_512939 [Neocallimastix californiae]|eukprot:ORY29211.1 hypothetical protein LY90DRAFT_512939 [Neocallimastix californiae]